MKIFKVFFENGKEINSFSFTTKLSEPIGSNKEQKLLSKARAFAKSAKWPQIAKKSAGRFF